MCKCTHAPMHTHHIHTPHTDSHTLTHTRTHTHGLNLRTFNCFSHIVVDDNRHIPAYNKQENTATYTNGRTCMDAYVRMYTPFPICWSTRALTETNVILHSIMEQMVATQRQHHSRYTPTWDTYNILTNTLVLSFMQQKCMYVCTYA